MSVDVQPAPVAGGVSAIFWALVAAFALSGAVLAAGDAGGVAVFVFVLVGWVISLCLHEWGHAYTAYRGGDDSVIGRGYLTLNPLLYTNPVLSIGLPLVFLAMGGIGFPGGSVYVRPELLRGPGWRAAMSAAGPAMNLLCLLVIALTLSTLDRGSIGAFGAALALLGFLQATALLLNLLPIPGLDGFGILQSVLPEGARAAVNSISRFAVMAFLVVMIAAPQYLAPLWSAAFGLCALLGINPQAVGEGLGLFRFWAPSGSIGG